MKDTPNDGGPAPVKIPRSIAMSKDVVESTEEESRLQNRSFSDYIECVLKDALMSFFKEGGES